MGPSIGNNGKENVSIRKIANGYSVHYTNEVKKLSADQNNFLYDYINETYAFDTVDEAIAKAQELVAKFV